MNIIPSHGKAPFFVRTFVLFYKMIPSKFNLKLLLPSRVCVMDEPKWRPNACPLRNELRHREQRVYANRDGLNDREQRDVQVWPIAYYRVLFSIFGPQLK